MPTSPALYLSGFGIFAAILVLTLVASVLTVVGSTLLLWTYRRSVARLMSVHAGENAGGRRIAAAPSSGSTQQHDPQLKAELGDKRYRRTMTQVRRHAAQYAFAGGLFALCLGVSAFLALSQSQSSYLRAPSHPLQALFLLWTFAWPIGFTVDMVIGLNWRRRSLMAAFYFVILLVLGGAAVILPTEAPIQTGAVVLPAWSGETPLRLIGKWGLFNLTPTILLLVFRNRRMRAVAPLVLSFTTAVSAGALGVITAAFVFKDTSVQALVFLGETFGLTARTSLIVYFLVLILLASLIFSLLGWWLLIRVRHNYRRKAVSNQSLEIDALWLIFASFYATVLAFAGPGWAVTPFAAFVVLKIALKLETRVLNREKDGTVAHPALLVLRVFSLGRRSEALFETVTRQWRYLGHVRMIAGSDLALATVTPDQFMAFVSGKVRQLFVRNSAAVERRLCELDTKRDADGRFRINTFFCHADTWQEMLTALVRSTDVVLMDLRSFSKNNAGCVFEISELLNLVVLARLVFVVDRTTDRKVLTETLQRCWRELKPDSPNLGAPLSDLRPFELASFQPGDLKGLTRQLCIAAS